MIPEWSLWRHALLTLICLIGVWLWLRRIVLPHTRNRAFDGSLLSILDRRIIGSGKELMIVQIEGRKCVLGITAGRIDLLFRYDSGSAESISGKELIP